MSKLILGLFGLLMLALPQVAGAQEQSQSFKSSHEYVAKFICGRHDDSNAGLGVVQGHYNTIINVLAIKNRTRVAGRATYVSSTAGCETNQGEPSSFEGGEDLDRDEAFGITCNDIKDLVDCGSGLVEGFVILYSLGPLEVTDVITGQGTGDGDGPLAVMEIYQVKERAAAEKISFPVEVQ